jgi:pyruvate kinase
MSSIEIRFISKDDMDTLDIGLQEAIDAVELGFKAHGEKKVIMPSKNL